jgi:hypothetical protein
MRSNPVRPKPVEGYLCFDRLSTNGFDNSKQTIA